MALTLAEKILQSHIMADACLEGKFQKGVPIERGAEIAIKIDQTLTQDATGTMAYLQFETIGIPRVKTELSVSYVDHNTLQTDHKNMDDHIYLQSVAARYGIHFSRPGNGICHQVHLECFGKPGKTLLGSDSHTPTGGALGMIAIGAGGLDVAVAMGGGAFHLAMPKIFGVRLSGALKKGCGAKDIILEVLRRETVKGGALAIYEYFGEGVQSLTVPQRATIANMGAELGATTSIFPSDENAKKFLCAMGRENDWTKLMADEGAAYDKIIEIDLSQLSPLAACPHNPDIIESVKNLSGKKITQVVIGSCTNSSLDDLESVAKIVKGKHVAQGVEAGIAPGSRAVLMMAQKSGILGVLIKAGFRILECACGPCIGQGFAPNSNGVTLRTFNRNFKGRSGTANAEIYLVSPETAAASAICGAISCAKDFSCEDSKNEGALENFCGCENPSKSENKNSFCSESLLYGKDARLSSCDILEAAKDRAMIIEPLSQSESEKAKILRGPNIKPCPECRPFQKTLSLFVMLKAADNVSTDDIMPAAAKILPLRSNIPEISKHAFSRIDNTFYERCEKNNFSDCAIIGGENYGQGSSREHAALAPMHLGVRAVLAKSFARIHKANLINYGILPLEFASCEDYDSICQGDTIFLSNIEEALDLGCEFEIKSGKKTFKAKNDFSKRSRAILKQGGLARYTKNGGN